MTSAERAEHHPDQAAEDLEDQTDDAAEDLDRDAHRRSLRGADVTPPLRSAQPTVPDVKA